MRRYQIYLLLLNILLQSFILIGCDRKNANINSDNTKNKLIEVNKEPAPQAKGGLNAFLPDPVEGGYKLQEGSKVYNPNNLFDLVDGGAEVYIDYGFNRVVAAKYVDDKNSNKYVNIQIFDMSSPIGAYGYFSFYNDQFSEPSKNPSTEMAELGQESLINGTELIFHKGNYYITVSYMNESADSEEQIAQEASDIIKGFASKIAKLIPGDPDFIPSILNKIPQEGRIKRGVLYAAKNLIGIESLGNGYNIRYDLNNKKFRLWIKECQTSQQALDDFNKVKSSMSKVEPVNSFGGQAVKGQTDIVGGLLMVSFDKYLFGIIDESPIMSEPAFEPEKKVEFLKTVIKMINETN